MSKVNSFKRVQAAAGAEMADAVPDELYLQYGAALAYFWENAVHDQDHFLGGFDIFVQSIFLLREHKVISTDQATQCLSTLYRKCDERGLGARHNLLGRVPSLQVKSQVINFNDWFNPIHNLGDPHHFRPRSNLPAVAPTNVASLPVKGLPPKPKLSPTAYVCEDPASIPRRAWLYGTHLIRQEVSVTLAPGGVGKTSLGVSEALAMASGRPLLGVPVDRPLRVWMWNGEEPEDELKRRIAAARTHYRLTADDIGDRLFVNNGHEMEITLAEQTGRDGTVIFEPVVDALVEALRERAVDVMIVDPFVSTHNVGENDNGAIQKAATAWKKVAVQAEAAIGLAHHTRKLGGREATSEDSRGADALMAKARDARVLNPMSIDDARALGITGDDRPSYFWTGPGGKSNMAPRTERKTWFRIASVGLGNGTGNGGLLNQDRVAVVTPWSPPKPEARLDPLAVERLGALMQGRTCRAAPQSWRSPDWIGAVVAEAFEIDRAGEAWTREAKVLVGLLEGAGIIKAADVRGADRNVIKASVFVGPVSEEATAA